MESRGGRKLSASARKFLSLKTSFLLNRRGQPDQHHHYTPEEYFAFETQSEERHEYFDGEILAMAGCTKSHNLITQNFTLALPGSLRGKGCQVFMEDVRLAVQDNFHYTYPDVVVTCDPADRRDP